MVRIAFSMVVCAALGLGATAASAQPPGHAKRAHATAEKKSDKGLLEQAVDTVLGRRDAEPTGLGRKNPNSNSQRLPDAKRGQERAAERRPAHAGPKHARGEEERSLLDQLLGEEERIERARSKREREKKLGKMKKQKNRKAEPSDELLDVLVEKVKVDKTKAKN
jgi:hypothetical protein